MGAKPSTLNVSDSVSKVMNNYYTDLQNQSKASSTAVNAYNATAKGDVEIGQIDQDSTAYVDMKSFSEAAASSDNTTKLKQAATQQATSDASSLTSSAAASNYVANYVNAVTTIDQNVSSQCISSAQSENVIDMKTEGDIKGNVISQTSFSKSLADCVNKSVTSNKTINDLQTSVSQTATAKTKSVLAQMMWVIIIIGVLILYVIIKKLMSGGPAAAAANPAKMIQMMEKDPELMKTIAGAVEKTV